MALVFAVVSSLATDAILRADREDPVAVRLHDLETERPKVLVLGSSLTHAAIDERLFEKSVGLPRGAVVNVAGLGMGLWEAEVFLANAELEPGSLVLIEVAPWIFNANWHQPLLHVPMRPTASFYRWAPFAHRWSKPGEGLHAVATTIAPVLRARRPLVEWIAYREALDQDWPFYGPRPPRDPSAPKVVHERNPDRPFHPTVISQWQLKDYAHSAVMLTHLERLLGQAEARGLRAVVWVPALVPSYFDRIRADPRAWKEYRVTHAALDALAHPIRFKSLEDMGTSRSGLRDYGHANGKGARGITKRLAAILERRGLVPH